MIDPYQNLANAIVLMAAKDYRKALQKLKKHPADKSSLAIVQDCEQFFYSDWFLILTDLNPDYLVERMRKEVNEHDGKRISAADRR